MDEKLKSKYQKLLSSLKEEESLAIAFSGGVDSTFLLAAAKEALGDHVLALTGRLSSVPASEEEKARAFCEKEKIRQIFCDLDVFLIDGYVNNPQNRCYLCKKALFHQFIAVAGKNGIHALAEGSNADDPCEYRPGLAALRELHVKSPLSDAGLHKDEIRSLSRELGLETWDKPSLSCLATRFPYGEKLTEEKFKKVYQAEEFLRKIGFSNVRVRAHRELARIEISPDEFEKILNPKIREDVLKEFSSIGFTYVTLDLRGFRSGSMDEVLPL